MKKLMFVAVACATFVAFGEETMCATAACCEGGATVAPADPATEAKVAPRTKAEDPGRMGRNARIEALRAQRKAEYEAAEKRAAEKQGITVDELRAQRKAKGEERAAKRMGVTVEEFRAMTPEQRKAKNAEIREKRRAERQAMKEARAAKKAAAETPKTTETK